MEGTECWASEPKSNKNYLNEKHRDESKNNYIEPKSGNIKTTMKTDRLHNAIM